MLRDIDQLFQHPNRKIQWILTVPAIWSEAAKQIMREAATQVCMSVHTENILYRYVTPYIIKNWKIMPARSNIVKLTVIINFTS